jgi:hypothetical protein
MKVVFVGYGLAYLGMTGAFLLNASWARPGMNIVALLGLWYLPFGTLINLAVLALLRLGSFPGRA